MAQVLSATGGADVSTVMRGAACHATDGLMACGCLVARRGFLARIGGVAIGATLAPRVVIAQASSADVGLDRELLDDLVAANRILAHQGVLDTFGHVSVRDPCNPDRFWMSCSKAPAQVTADDIMQYDLDCNPLDARGRPSYYEKWIHGEMYRMRDDVQCVVPSHSPTVIPFSVSRVPLWPLLQMAGFLAFGVPVFDSGRFIADPDLMIGQPMLGREMARVLGPTSDVVLLRGHGDVVVGASIELAVFRAYYTEINARAQQQAIALGGGEIRYLSVRERMAAEKVVGSTSSVNRAWQQWKKDVSF
jgi:ribulose-5-phosphate 4-epimerase/fuculose-1-phosphate aldolase